MANSKDDPIETVLALRSAPNDLAPDLTPVED
jgi:hypothetical protein